MQPARPGTFAILAPCPWMTNCQPIKLIVPNFLSNSQCQYTVLRNWQGLSLHSPSWWAQAPANGQNYTKNSQFFVFWRMKPPFSKWIEVQRALSREHLLCDIIPTCHSQTPGLYFGRNGGFKLPYCTPSKPLFCEFSKVVDHLKGVHYLQNFFFQNWVF